MTELIDIFLEDGDIFFKIISASIAIVFIIADWRIHIKAGEKGWIALIPIYNVYSFYKIVWKKSAFWWSILAELPVLVVSLFIEDFHMNNPLLLFLFILTSAMNSAFVIYTNYKTAKAFGHGVGFTLGLTFLYDIFILIISFGKSKYVKAENH